MTIELRPYQLEGKEAVNTSWDAGYKNVLLVEPTGAGKTVMLSSIVHDEPGAVCVVAHRQELVSQISMALSKNGIYHRIIGPKKVIDMIINMQMNEFGKIFYNDQGKVAVAGVDTLVRRGEELKRWLPTVKLWVIDECFPAGTMIGDTPIENIKLGDHVTAFDEETETYHQRKVTRLFKNNIPPYMVSIKTKSHHMLESTCFHPYWTKRGWLNAVDLTINDEVLIYEMSYVQQSRERYIPFKENKKILLFKKMFKRISFSNLFKNNEKDKLKICLRENEEKQSYEESEITKENVGHVETNRTQTKDTRGQRKGSNGIRESIEKIIKTLRIQTTTYSEDWFTRTFNGLSLSLQDRLWSWRTKDCNRNRWFKSSIIRTSGTRPQKGHVSYWSRVANIQVHESSNNGTTKEDFVYNIEVDEFHTYIANGIVVHNCHHVLTKNKWGKAVEMFPNARGLGVTATPLRADGKGLGAGEDNDGEFHDMVVGPSMRDLINQGYLTDYRIFAPVNNIDMSDARISKATGDWNKNDVSSAVAKSSLITHDKSTVVGDVVSHYLKIAPGKLGITFVPDMNTGREIEAQFNAVGIPAILVNAKTPDNERASILRRFAKREYLQLINVDLFGEGFDLPSLEVVSFARPTQSYGLFVQMFGRVLRILLGKTHGIIIDHVGNVARHGLPDSPRSWSLERRTKRNDDDDAIPVKTCPECTFVYERYKKSCPECGLAPIPADRSDIKFVDGDLSELSPEILAEMRGEVEAVDQPIDDQLLEYRRQLQLKHTKPLHVTAHCNRMSVKLLHQKESQVMLRDKMAWWAGHRRAEGKTDNEIFKIFYLKYGINWVSAQALPGDDADFLNEKIMWEI